MSRRFRVLFRILQILHVLFSINFCAHAPKSIYDDLVLLKRYARGWLIDNHFTNNG